MAAVGSEEGRKKLGSAVEDREEGRAVEEREEGPERGVGFRG